MDRSLKITAILLLLLATLTGFSFAAPRSLCWLLDSPLREHLSGESALLAACQPIHNEWTSAKRTFADSFRHTGPNLLVNDPTTDMPEQTTQSETTIAIYKNIVLVAFVDTGQFLPRTIGISSLSGYARSENGGQTFIDMGRVPPGPRSVGFSDPSLGVDSPGVFYFANIHQVPGPRANLSYMGVAKSSDGGQTFSDAVLIKGTGLEDLHFQDKELIAVDNTGGRFEGRVYMAWTEFAPGGSRILFVRSTDGGATFSAPSILSSDIESVQGATPAVGPEGEVYITWIAFEGSERILKIRRSDDGGVAFGPAAIAAKIARTADAQATRDCRRQALKGGIRTLELPAVAVDHSPTSFWRGSIYVTYQSDPDGPGPDTSDLFLVRSSDGGQTFSAPVRLNDDQTQSDQFMPAATVAPDGTVGVMWYDRRLDPENSKIDLYFARSRDGGQSFEPNQRVTDVSFDVPPTFAQRTSSGNFDSQRGICYMGDYNQMVADESFFYLTWGDNRNIIKTENYSNGRPDSDVYFTKIPIQPSAR